MYISFLCIVCLHLLSGLFVDIMSRSGSQPFVSLGNFLSRCMMFRHFKDPPISSFPNLSSIYLYCCCFSWYWWFLTQSSVMKEMWQVFLMLDVNLHITQLTDQVCFSECIDCEDFVLHIYFKI